MSAGDLIRRLGLVVASATRLIDTIDSTRNLSADDEFDAEYLLENITKELRKLERIGRGYEKVPSVTSEATGTVSEKASRITRENRTAALSRHPADEECRFDEDVVSDETTDITDHTRHDSDEDAVNRRQQKDPREAELSQNVNANNVTIDGDEADGFMDDDDDFDDEALQQIEEAERSFTLDETVPPKPDNEDYDASNQPTDVRFLEVLKKYFGYSKFRPLQWKIIDAVLHGGRDSCVVMATGYGKSLCYQYPSVFTGRLTVVISPLISLMEDQVMALSSANISACLLGSAQEKTAQVKNGLLRGEYRVLYVTPEFTAVASDWLKELHSKVGIDLLAIDEAHCVSQWGHDFRAAYRSLGSLRNTLPKVPLMALTATATPEVMMDICRSLKLRNPLMTCTSFDRPNLYLSVMMKSGNIMSDLRSQMIRIAADDYEFEGATIIYCPTKKSTEDVLNVVKMLGVKCAQYHANLSMTVRKTAHRQFINDEVQVVVATVAFGMGIDKPDVRSIIHFGAPKDIESYYQEIGRAGRDGLNSTCHVFYSTADFMTNKYFLNEIKNESFLKHKKLMLRKMEEYLATTKCRRRAILSHFENKEVVDVGGTDRCCDNCTRRARQVQSHDLHGGGLVPMDEEVNYGKEARDLFSAIEMTEGRYGITVPVYLLRGSTNQRLPPRYHKYELHGKGKYRSEKWWKAFARQLTTEGYLEECPIPNSFGCTMDLSTKGGKWLRGLSGSKEGDPVLRFLPNQELTGAEKECIRAPGMISVAVSKILPMVPSSDWLSSRGSSVATPGGNAITTDVDPKEHELQVELYVKLIALRNDISHQMEMHTYMIFSNKSLLDMAKYRPTSVQNLAAMEEVAEEKARKYGDSFTRLIRQFCAGKSWKMDVMPGEVEVTAKFDSKLQTAFVGLKDTVRATYQLFEREKKSMESVASSRGIKTSTVVAHMSDCITAGLPVDMRRLGLSEGIEKLIIDTIRRPPINSDISRMTPIKQELPDYVEFNHIKLVIALLQYKFGMTNSHVDTANLYDDTNRHSTSTAATSLARFSSSSQSDGRVAASQSAASKSRQSAAMAGSQPSKRRLPDWMNKGMAQTTTKKTKGSLFRR